MSGKKPEEDFDNDDSDESEEEDDTSGDDDDGDAPEENDNGKDEEDEFEFGSNLPEKKEEKEPTQTGVAQAVQNQHFDEALSVSEDEESIDDSVSMDQSMDQQVRAQAPVAASAPAAAPASKPAAAKKAESSSEEESDDDDDDSDDGDSDDEKPSATAAAVQQPAAGTSAPAPSSLAAAKKEKVEKDNDDDEEESSSGSESDEDEGSTGGDGAKLYDPKDYSHLKVSAEIQDLFDYIGRYKPPDIELETKLQPFIPDFIPAVGEIDPFIKIPPPDGKPDDLGLVVLDEPAAHQSDPTVLDIKIRVMSKHTGLAPVKVRSIENADKNPKRITTWINNIEEVHRKKPPPAVNYSKNMPDIEGLMQVWPTEFEELLKEIPLPSADLDMDLAQYAKIVCALLDIPVYDKLTESLHVLFTLYTEFKNNAHFQQ